MGHRSPSSVAADSTLSQMRTQKVKEAVHPIHCCSCCVKWDGCCWKEGGIVVERQIWMARACRSRTKLQPTEAVGLYHHRSWENHRNRWSKRTRRFGRSRGFLILSFLLSVATAKTTCCSWEKKEKQGVRRTVGGQRDELAHCQRLKTM